MISSCVLARSPPTKLLWPITIRMRSGTFSLWDLGFLHMKIFSELIIDSCFQNSEYCTCSIFRMISASSICSMLFCIIFLAKFGWTGRPQPSLQVACGRAQALSSIFDKNVWSTNDFQKYGVCEKIVKSKRKDNFDFLLSFIPHCGPSRCPHLISFKSKSLKNHQTQTVLPRDRWARRSSLTKLPKLNVATKQKTLGFRNRLPNPLGKLMPISHGATFHPKTGDDKLPRKSGQVVPQPTSSNSWKSSQSWS